MSEVTHLINMSNAPITTALAMKISNIKAALIRERAENAPEVITSVDDLAAEVMMLQRNVNELWSFMSEVMVAVHQLETTTTPDIALGQG